MAGARNPVNTRSNRPPLGKRERREEALRKLGRTVDQALTGTLPDDRARNRLHDSQSITSEAAAMDE